MDWALRKLAFAAAMAAWVALPGVLLLPVLSGLPDIMAGGIAVGVSLIFWRGVRTWPAGRAVTDAVLAYVARD